jgi:hypothetical protein
VGHVSILHSVFPDFRWQQYRCVNSVIVTVCTVANEEEKITDRSRNQEPAAKALAGRTRSGVLGVELDYLLEVELREGPAVAGEPEDVLEQDGVDVDEEEVPAAPALLPPRRRLEEHAERVRVQHEPVHRERPPLLPDHDRHRMVFGGGVQRAVAEAGVRGQRPPEEDAAAGHLARRTACSVSWLATTAALLRFPRALFFRRKRSRLYGWTRQTGLLNEPLERFCGTGPAASENPLRAVCGLKHG